MKALLFEQQQRKRRILGKMREVGGRHDLVMSHIDALLLRPPLLRLIDSILSNKSMIHSTLYLNLLYRYYLLDKQQPYGNLGSSKKECVEVERGLVL